MARKAQAKGQDLSEATATAYFGGRHAKHPSLATLEAFASVLPVTLAELQAAAGVPRTGAEWVPDAEQARLLDDDQRKVLDSLLRVMTRHSGQEGAREAGHRRTGRRKT